MFHERDEHGRIVWKNAPDKYTEEDAFRDRWRAWGLREDEITKKYQEFWVIEGYRDSLERAAPTGMTPEAVIAFNQSVDQRVCQYAAKIAANRKWGR